MFTFSSILCSAEIGWWRKIEFSHHLHFHCKIFFITCKSILFLKWNSSIPREIFLILVNVNQIPSVIVLGVIEKGLKPSWILSSLSLSAHVSLFCLFFHCWSYILGVFISHCWHPWHIKCNMLCTWFTAILYNFTVTSRLITELGHWKPKQQGWYWRHFHSSQVLKWKYVLKLFWKEDV